MVGHASMLIQTAGLNILTDPVWSDRVSPFSFAGPSGSTRRASPSRTCRRSTSCWSATITTTISTLATLARLKAAHDPLIVTPLGNDAIIKAAIPACAVDGA